MTLDETLNYYADRYAVVGLWQLHPNSPKTYLGEKTDKHCRFCKRTNDAITFKKKAHAIPEALGNKTLFSHYECDDCNAFFGQTIETDFGAWSKPMRTMCRIGGKSGAPSIRLSQDGSARIDVRDGNFEIRDYENDPKFYIDTAANKVTFSLKRDTYIPIAVLKAFTKFGLTLMPAEVMNKFEPTRQWIKNPDHSANFVTKIPLIHTFIAGPMPNDRIGLCAFIRKAGATDTPFAFYILTYGNEMFKVFIPCPIEDQFLQNVTKSIKDYPYAVQFGQVPAYKCCTKNLNLMKRDRVKGEINSVGMHFDGIEIIPPQD